MEILCKINLEIRDFLPIFAVRKTIRDMILENGVKVYESLLKICVEYVNKGWKMSYKIEDVTGIELGETYMYVHFNKEDYTKDAYPISIEIIFK